MAGKLSKNNWVVTVVGGALSVLLLRLIDWLFINDYLWDSIKDFFGSALDFFNKQYTVRLYFLILLPIMVIIAIIGLLYLIISFTGSKDPGSPLSPYPDWKNYTRDVFGSLQYRWQYNFFGNNYSIENLQRYCNQCSCPLVNLRCPVCKTNYAHGHDIKSHEELQALIQHRIDNGLYKKTTP